MTRLDSIMEHLRTATRDQHTLVDSLPFFTALAARDLPRKSYIGLLSALEIVHEALEQALMQSNDVTIAAVWDEPMRKLPLIQRDLAYFAPDKDVAVADALLRAHVLAALIERRANQNPVSLLGYLYVFEGSTLGGMILRSQVAQAFGLDKTQGVAYLSSYEKRTKAHWEQFTQRMNVALNNAETQSHVVAAAREAFDGVTQILMALYPLAGQPLRELVNALNPSAGHHPIPDDLREVRAALRAGEVSWQEFPYYEWRYGMRGKQFTWSDSAWLVTLAYYPQVEVDHQVAWLGQVLAARGMPQWMLERHLEILYRELSAAIPEKEAIYTTLLNTARQLRASRLARLSDEAFQTLSSAFDAMVGPEWSRKLPDTGKLLIAAVTDELSGIKNAVASLESWMTDSSRFPVSWIEAVRMTIRRAREAAKRDK